MVWVSFIVGCLLFVALPAVFLRFGFSASWSGWLSRGTLLAYLLIGIGISGVFLFRESHPDAAQFFSVLAQTIGLAMWAIVVSGLVWLPLKFWAKCLNTKAPEVDLGRRSLILKSAATVPALSFACTPLGVGAALQDPILKRVSMSLGPASAGLLGMRILHLTDVHLGLHIGVQQIQKIVRLAAVAKPDLVVLTGDIADDYSKLEPALDSLATLEPPLGIFACIGNHEIYRGREEAERIYQNKGVGFLCNKGVALEINGSKFWLAGADDPARQWRRRRIFFHETVDTALAEKPVDIPITILLCHRPQGFDAAAERGVTLTLAGHTHGGQIGFGGRSLFEPFAPKSYLMGHYQRGQSHLYTSAGLGHWLPFRVNCPAEAVLIELGSDKKEKTAI